MSDLLFLAWIDPGLPPLSLGAAFCEAARLCSLFPHLFLYPSSINSHCAIERADFIHEFASHHDGQESMHGKE